MRFPILALALVLAAPTLSAQSANQPLTLAEALRLAVQSNPSVRAREAQLSAVDGSRREAAALLQSNPELGADLIRRRLNAPGGSWNEWALSVAQPFETGGQQARRREAADASMGAVRAEIDDAQRQAMGTAASRFYAVLAAQQRLRIERRGVELFASTAAAVDKRRAAGEDTRLDANLALVEADRARNALDAAEDRLIEARSELATALQLPPSAVPEVSGELASTLAEAPRYDLPRLLESARSQPRIGALSARETAARSRLELERANRYPNVTVGLAVGQEGPGDARERLSALTLSMPLPLFNRNDAAIGQAISDVTQARSNAAAPRVTASPGCCNCGIACPARLPACGDSKARWCPPPGGAGSWPSARGRPARSACSTS